MNMETTEERLKQHKQITCKKCGSTKFIALIEQNISDAFSDGMDPIADHTIDKETIHQLRCAKCGNMVIESFLKKPIPKNAWEKHWSSILVDFIISFEHCLVRRDLEDEDDKEEAYLRGIAKGMWGLYDFIEKLMVQDKLVVGQKTTYQLTALHELKLVAHA